MSFENPSVDQNTFTFFQTEQAQINEFSGVKCTFEECCNPSYKLVREATVSEEDFKLLNATLMGKPVVSLLTRKLTIP